MRYSQLPVLNKKIGFVCWKKQVAKLCKLPDDHQKSAKTLYLEEIVSSKSSKCKSEKIKIWKNSLPTWYSLPSLITKDI